MQDKNQITQAAFPRVFNITIPSSAAPARLSTLLGSSDVSRAVAYRILPRVAAGTNRSAFLYSHDSASMLGHVNAGEEWDRAVFDAASIFLSAVDTTPFTAVVEVLVGQSAP